MTDDIYASGRYLKISHPSDGGKNFCVVQIGVAGFSRIAINEVELLEGDGDIGDSVLFELVTMTEQEFDDLGEFDGW